MKTKYKWIRFEDRHGYWDCYNTSNQDLGFIEYNQGWRQFVFVIHNVKDHEKIIQFNFRCLEDIADFLKQLNRTKGCYKKKKKDE